MGEIWLAERRAEGGFQKRVVIKTILPPFNEDQEVVELFLREGRIAAGLNHRNIAQVFDQGRQGDVYFLAMEYIEGRDVRHLLIDTIEKGRHLPLNIVLRIAADACEGLYYAHNWKTPEGRPAPIIHRDISPQNILVAFDGGVKIIDFGIAKAMHLASRTRSGVLKGKYAYMSPEQVRGEELDGRSDIFSLGVVLYEMTTSRRLFKRQSEMSTLEAVIKAEVPPPRRIDSTVPAEIEAVILRALQAERERRFPDARQMQLALEEVMTRTGLTASSVHLSTYLQENFGAGQTKGPEKACRPLEELAGVTEKSKSLERTGAYRLDHDSQPPTKNLLPSARSKLPLPRRRRLWPLFAALGALALLTAALFFFFGHGRTLPSGPPAWPPPVVMQPDAQAEPKPPAPEPAPSPEPEKPPAQPENLPALAVENKPAPAYAQLSVATQQEAEIFLDGRKAGKGKLVRAVKPGRHLVEARLPEGGRRSQEINLLPGEKLSLDLSLRPGTLRVLVNPYADIYLNGKTFGETPLAPRNLFEGRYRLRLVNDKLGKSEEFEIEIKAGEETRISRDWRQGTQM
jgi:serine/threonine protein kinase